MIDFIEGTVADKTPGELVISAGGVGFLLMCSAATLAEAPSVGEKWKINDLYENVLPKHERDMFRRLCQITGIGAKTALGVLSSMPLRDLSVAIVTGDVAALSRAPGIGKKTAQRIVLELKDKVEQADLSHAGGASIPAAPVGNAQREAQAALQALGYTSAEAARAVNLVRDQADTVDALVMLALKQVGSL